MAQDPVSQLQEALQVGGNEDSSRPALEGRGEDWCGAWGGLQGRGHPQVFHLRGKDRIRKEALLSGRGCHR